MRTLCIILARAGSKGLPAKNALELHDHPMVHWTIEHTRLARRLTRTIVSTDDPTVALTARRAMLTVIDRPPDLATDAAPVAAAARHALLTIEDEENRTYDNAVILYANVPLRPPDLIDRAIDKLRDSRCDSVQSLCPVGKHHPFWMKTLTGPDHDRIQPFIENTIDRRQNLPPVYALDGGVIAVRRDLLAAPPDSNPHGFLGSDRRAIITQPGEVVDIDTQHDLRIAEHLPRPTPKQEIAPHDGTQNPIVRIRHHPILHPLATPVYIIAELGVNHDGSLDRALELTRAAEHAGADAVKLQLFDPHLLLSAEAEFAAYQKDTAADPFAMLAALQLPVDAILKVKQLAHQLDLGFIVTPFSIENLDDMKRLDPDAVKIASPDCVNRPLIDAMKTLDKPLILSTGACNEQEIKQTAHWCAGRPFVMLRCVSAYPTPSHQCRVNEIGSLRLLGASTCGYSDHTTDLHTGALAVFHDAAVIEKHLTHDTAAPGPDHAASLDPRQFTEYVRLIRLAEQQFKFSTDNPQPLPIELDVRRVSRQSLCAVQDLKAGTKLQRQHLTVKRPGTGIPAARLDEAIGKTLHRDIAANHLLHEGDVEW